MNQDIVLKHEFVEFIPAELRQGTIYVSIRFGTASHMCVCGCGNKVVTPLRPTDWKLIYDGKSVSLDPSIGNWSFACQSHYWIKNNRVRRAERWCKEHVDAGREHDRRVKREHFQAVEAPRAAAQLTTLPREESLWQKLRNWWHR